MPQEIINKPGKLTDNEFAIIKQHSVRGHELLLASDVANAHVLDVCRHHVRPPLQSGWDPAESVARMASWQGHFSTRSGLLLEPKLVDLADPLCRDKITAREPPEKWNFPYPKDLSAASP